MKILPLLLVSLPALGAMTPDDANRTYQWSYAGAIGGIQTNRTMFRQHVSDGRLSQRSANIANHSAECHQRLPSGQYVYIPQANSALQFRSAGANKQNISIRGAERGP